MPSFAGAASLLAVTAVLTASCASSRGGELDPRYVAVHNAYSAIGLTEIGPLQQGSLGEGNEARVTVDLTAQCVTLVGIGGDGVRDLDVSLLDPNAKQVAHDTTHEPEAVVRACLDAPGTYTLVVKMAAGSGTYVAATWSGGLSGTATSAAFDGGGGLAINQAPQGSGTCESPIALAAGTVSGRTTGGESLQDGSCGKESGAKELVYRLELRDRQRVAVEVAAHFDSILYIRKDDCADSTAEVVNGCNDDAPSQDRSRLELVLDPGVYFVFVDGYNKESGAFRMTTTVADIPAIADVCRGARPLSLGSQMSGSTSGGFDNAKATCGSNARGDDVPYKLDLNQRSRVRLTQESSEFPPVTYIRRSCADEQSEIACADTGMAGANEATYVGLLDPGSYTVWADSKDHDASGHFTLMCETAPEQGSGTVGDDCGDAQPLRASDHTVSGDTFLARDSVSSKCGGGGADVFYRIDLPKRARVNAEFTKEERRHNFVLSRACADRTAEIACGGQLDQVLAPGTYFLAVDGAAPDSYGRYEFEWRVRDIGGQEAACRNPALLVEGQQSGTTAGSADKWSTSCAGAEAGQASADKMYKLVLGARTHVRLSLETLTWDGVLVLRRACMDAGSASRSGEIQCNNDSDDAHHARIDQILEPGTYYVLVDGHQAGNEGPFTLDYSILR